MSQLLEKLFGEPARLRLLKFFFMNPEARFTAPEALRRTHIPKRQFERIVGDFLRLQALSREVRRRVEPAEVRGERSRSRRKKSRSRMARERVFFANTAFAFFPELRALVLKSIPHARGELIAKLRGVGSVKLALLGGVFANEPVSRVDLLLVADKVRRPKLHSLLRWLEAVVGRELNYALMSSQEFRYRRDLFDHFIREVLESPHEKVINKLGV